MKKEKCQFKSCQFKARVKFGQKLAVKFQTLFYYMAIYTLAVQHNSIFLGRSASGPIGPPLFHFYTLAVTVGF
jgi:hypothetical protein